MELTRMRTGIPPLLSQRNAFQGVKCLKWYVKNNYIYNVKERITKHYNTYVGIGVTLFHFFTIMSLLSFKR